MRLTFKNGLYIENWYAGKVSLDGGGTTQYLDFTNSIKNLNKNYDRALEWCSGLGAIGFSLLDSNICNHVTFMDVYQPASDYVLKMAALNNISHKVTARCIGKIKDLPSSEKFDVIVGNPPHVINQGVTLEEAHALDVKRGFPLRDKWFVDNDNRLTVDTDWKIHTEFFNNIGDYCNPGCDLFISEVGGQEHLNIVLAEKSNFKLKQHFPAPFLANHSHHRACIQWFTYQPGSI